MHDHTLQPGETAFSYDLTQKGYRRAWDVSTLDSGVVRFDMVNGAIGSATVTLEQTHDWRTWQGLASAVVVSASAIASGAEGMTTRLLDFTAVRGIAAVVTDKTSGATAALTLYGKNSQTIV